MNLNQDCHSPYSKKEVFQERIELQEDNEDDEQQHQHKIRQSIVFLEQNAFKSDDIMPSISTQPNSENQSATFFKEDPQIERFQSQTEHNVERQKWIRIGFSIGFLAFLAISMFWTERKDVIAPSMCLRDYTFIWTTEINSFLNENVDFRNKYIIFASFMMDIMFISFFILFYKYWKTFRVFLAYPLFFGCRGFIQNTFFVGRPQGFAFFDPGFYSMSVPYHDVNDFFYSGHVGTCLIIMLEYRTAKFYKMSYFILFILINQWTMLFLVRTHFIIDLVTGILMAFYFFRIAEQLSYLSDVLVLGIPGKHRFRYFFKPCHCCGIGNKCAKDYITKEEKKLLKSINVQQKRLTNDIKIKSDDVFDIEKKPQKCMDEESPNNEERNQNF